MPNRPPYTVTEAITELTDGLTDGQDYIAQHAGGNIILYADYPTQPTLETGIGWFSLKESQLMRFQGSASEPTWVRTLRGQATLSIKEI